MDLPKKFHKPPANLTYKVDGTAFGLDDRLVDALNRSILKKLEAGTLVIPRLPQAAMRVMQLSESPDAGMDDIAKVVLTDPGLAARVMSIANSAAYSGMGGVTGVQQALARLGMKNVSNLVFTESLQTKVFTAKAHRAALERSWRLSIGCAVACEVLAGATGLEKDSAFLMGLLHDTGTPTLLNAAAEYARENQGRFLDDDTVDILLMQLHEQAGAHVLKQWGMPDPIVLAASGHHLYRGPNGQPAPRIVHAANRICQHLGIAEDAAEVNFTTEHVFVDLKLNDPDAMLDVLARVQVGFDSLMSGFGGAGGAAHAA